MKRWLSVGLLMIGLWLTLVVIIGIGLVGWEMKKQPGLTVKEAAVTRFLPIAQNVTRLSEPEEEVTEAPSDFELIWYSDFEGDAIGAVDRTGKEIWYQQMGSPPIPTASYATNTEYVTVAPNGNLIVADGDGMMVQEISREKHELVWQYGVKDKQDYAGGQLHQPDKSWKLNDHEVLINDGNNRRVIIVDQNTNEIVWQYGVTKKMGSGPGLLRGNTSVRPIENNTKFLITDTLEEKVFLVDRESNQLEYTWEVPDVKWIQHVWYTPEGTLVMEDRQKHEIFELDQNSQRLWTWNTFADGSTVKYPSDVIKLATGNLLVAEAGRGRIIEVNPKTGEIVWEYDHAGFVTTIDIDPVE